MYTVNVNKEIDQLIVDSFGNKFENVTEKIIKDILEWKKLQVRNF